jgi:hypothetical protein
LSSGLSVIIGRCLWQVARNRGLLCAHGNCPRQKQAQQQNETPATATQLHPSVPAQPDTRDCIYTKELGARAATVLEPTRFLMRDCGTMSCR